MKMLNGMVRLGGAIALMGVAYCAAADERPARKPGLWEFKIVRQNGLVGPKLIKQLCTDETTPFAFSEGSGCSKQVMRKTGAGYSIAWGCKTQAVRVTAKVDLAGDFTSSYTMDTNLIFDIVGSPVPHTMGGTLSAKWVGACEAGQKPGDLIYEDGTKGNVNEL